MLYVESIYYSYKGYMELSKRYTKYSTIYPPLQPRRSVFYSKLNPNLFIKTQKLQIFLKINFKNKMKILNSVRFYRLVKGKKKI